MKYKRNRQCKSKSFFSGECQGISGHKNNHWSYNLTGSLIQWKNKKFIKKQNWASSLTPPGHKHWISPVKMMKFHYIFGSKK